MGVHGTVEIRRADPSALSIVAAGITCLAIGTLVSPLRVFALCGLLLAVGGGVCGAIASASALLASARAERPSASRHPRPTIVIVTILLTWLIALGAVELLVWCPLAQTNGYPLPEIYAALSELDRGYSVTFIVIWIVFWMLGVAAFAVVVPQVVRRVGITARTVWALEFGLAAAIVIFQFWARFSLKSCLNHITTPHIKIGMLQRPIEPAYHRSDIFTRSSGSFRSLLRSFCGLRRGGCESSSLLE